MTRVFVETTVVLFREGLEALLLVASMATYLNKLGARRLLFALYCGVGLAIVASLAVAWLVDDLAIGRQAATFLGVALLVAACSMLAVSGWLLLGRRAGVWQSYLAKGVDYAVSRQTGWVIAGLSFLVVAREGAEAVLFIVAISKGAGGLSNDLLAGVLAGSALLAVSFLIVQVAARHTTLRLMFLVTSFLFFLMAIKFVGEGFEILQEQGVIAATPITGGYWLSVLGFNPSWEALVVQLTIILLAVTGCMTLPFRRRAHDAS